MGFIARLSCDNLKMLPYAKEIAGYIIEEMTKELIMKIVELIKTCLYIYKQMLLINYEQLQTSDYSKLVGHDSLLKGFEQKH